MSLGTCLDGNYLTTLGNDGSKQTKNEVSK